MVKKSIAPEITERKVLAGWKLRIGVLMAIITPSIAATGAFYKAQINLMESDRVNERRISKLELDMHSNYVDKPTVDRLTEQVQQTHDSVIRIETLLRKRL